MRVLWLWYSQLDLQQRATVERAGGYESITTMPPALGRILLAVFVIATLLVIVFLRRGEKDTGILLLLPFWFGQFPSQAAENLVRRFINRPVIGSYLEIAELCGGILPK